MIDCILLVFLKAIPCLSLDKIKVLNKFFAVHNKEILK